MLGLCLRHRPPFCVSKVGALVARQQRLVDALALNDLRKQHRQKVCAAGATALIGQKVCAACGWAAGFVCSTRRLRLAACAGDGAFVRLAACASALVAGVGAFALVPLSALAPLRDFRL